jgi:hypothetical protein
MQAVGPQHDHEIALGTAGSIEACNSPPIPLR